MLEVQLLEVWGVQMCGHVIYHMSYKITDYVMLCSFVDLDKWLKENEKKEPALKIYCHKIMNCRYMFFAGQCTCQYLKILNNESVLNVVSSNFLIN